MSKKDCQKDHLYEPNVKFKKGDATFLLDPETDEVGIRGEQNTTTPFAVARLSHDVVVRYLELFFRDVVLQRIEDIGFDDIVEEHADGAIRHAIEQVVARGWKDSSIEKEVQRHVRALVVNKIANEYAVHVDVSVRRK